uniref:Uncharacterized protein n=1 Tax=Panagrolaimus sp. PS1159 TaxID=55785 RepID=A0AC35G2Q7_9BILA
MKNIVNPFEFPRQQDGDQKNESEVMQFKAFQQLLGSDRQPVSQEIGYNDGHIVPQMAPDYGKYKLRGSYCTFKAK